MPFVDDSSQLYGASNTADASFVIELDLGGDFLPEAFSPFVDSEFDGVIELGGDFAGESYSEFADTEFDGEIFLQGDFTAEVYSPFADTAFDGTIELGGDFAPIVERVNSFIGTIELGGDFECDTVLALIEPAPITKTIAAGAFSVQRYAAGGGRLFINEVLTPFVSAEINAPSKALGKSLKIELASADLAQLPLDATFKFEIGKVAASGVTTWHTILDGGKLEGRTFSMSVGRNSLNFSTTQGTERLNRCPKNNLIVYDPSKAEVSVDEIENIPTNTGELITTTKQAVNVLTLKKLLDIAFVEGCGFASVDTDIPNYEIARCDFTVANSYAAAIAQFIGVYEPEFSIDGENNLTIQKTVNPLPNDFEPNQLTVGKIPSFTETAEFPSSSIDGFTLIYMGTGGTYYVDRTETPKVEPMGDAEFGDANFVETTTTRKYRDWFEAEDPITPARTELKEETVETRENGVLKGREIKINQFDALGRSKGYTNTVEMRLPDVAAGGTPSLLKTHEEAQTISYKSNPFAPRQTVLSRIETIQRSLLAIDSENTALDKNGEDSPYGQNYEEVFKNGNLKLGMTSSFATLETVIERFRPLANGQIEVRLEGYDFLRGKPKKSDTDIRSGDISVPNFQKQKVKTIFKQGVTQAARIGDDLPALNCGELPLQFAEPLADWLLANGRIRAQIEVTGYDESIERGVSFNLRGRENEDLGNYLTSGYRVTIRPGSITTNLDALKV